MPNKPTTKKKKAAKGRALSPHLAALHDAIPRMFPVTTTLPPWLQGYMSTDPGSKFYESPSGLIVEINREGLVTTHRQTFPAGRNSRRMYALNDLMIALDDTYVSQAKAKSSPPNEDRNSRDQRELREFLKAGFLQMAYPQWLTNTGREPGTLYYQLPTQPDSCIEVLPDGRRTRLHSMNAQGDTRWTPIVSAKDLMMEIRNRFLEMKDGFVRDIKRAAQAPVSVDEGIRRVVREEIRRVFRERPTVGFTPFTHHPMFPPPGWPGW